MSTKAIRVILESRLSTWAAARVPALRISFENNAFTPAAGETYLRATLLPANTGSLDLKGDHRLYRGVFQIDVRRPIGSGAGPALDIAAELNTLFPVNGRYTSGTVTVQAITPPSAAQGAQADSEYVVPVSFQYRADVI